MQQCDGWGMRRGSVAHLSFPFPQVHAQGQTWCWRGRRWWCRCAHSRVSMQRWWQQRSQYQSATSTYSTHTSNQFTVHVSLLTRIIYFLGSTCVWSVITAHNLTPAKRDESILGDVHWILADVWAYVLATHTPRHVSWNKRVTTRL